MPRFCELDFSDKYHNNVVFNLQSFGFYENISCITSKGAAHHDNNIHRNLVKGNKHFRSSVETH